nr:immunoglobulin light chain junction region [Macaca mulatta]
CQRYISTPFTF